MTVTKQYILVTTKRRWCSAAGKVTVGLAKSNGNLPRVDDLSLQLNIISAIGKETFCQSTGTPLHAPNLVNVGPENARLASFYPPPKFSHWETQPALPHGGYITDSRQTLVYVLCSGMSNRMPGGLTLSFAIHLVILEAMRSLRSQAVVSGRVTKHFQLSCRIYSPIVSSPSLRFPAFFAPSAKLPLL